MIYLLVVRKPNPPRNTTQPIAASAVDTSAICKKGPRGLCINVKCIILCNNLPHFEHHYNSYYGIYNTNLQHMELLSQLHNPLTHHLYKYANSLIYSRVLLSRFANCQGPVMLRLYTMFWLWLYIKYAVKNISSNYNIRKQEGTYTHCIYEQYLQFAHTLYISTVLSFLKLSGDQHMQIKPRHRNHTLPCHSMFQASTQCCVRGTIHRVDPGV